MKKYIILILTIVCTCLIWMGCSNSVSSDEDTNTSWVFVANEGISYSLDENDNVPGSISMIDENNNITNIENIGKTVQSLEVYNNKLFVIVTDDHKIITYNIDSDGITFEDEILTNSSMPREMVIINDKIYFTNLETRDIKIFDINNNKLEESTISINGRPENIIYDGTHIWVSIPEISKWDGNQGTKVAKIDPSTNEVIEYLEVGRGPQVLLAHNNEIFISRTYYSDDFLTTYHGATKIIGTETIENTYGSGAPCGGSIMSYENKIYRSQNWIPSDEEGIVPLDDDLNFIALGRIGNYQSPLIIYHMENINDQIYFTITDFGSTNLVKVLDNAGNEIASYTAGMMPGDLAYWKKTE